MTASSRIASWGILHGWSGPRRYLLSCLPVVQALIRPAVSLPTLSISFSHSSNPWTNSPASSGPPPPPPPPPGPASAPVEEEEVGGGREARSMISGRRVLSAECSVGLKLGSSILPPPPSTPSHLPLSLSGGEHSH